MAKIYILFIWSFPLRFNNPKQIDKVQNDWLLRSGYFDETCLGSIVKITNNIFQIKPWAIHGVCIFHHYYSLLYLLNIDNWISIILDWIVYSISYSDIQWLHFSQQNGVDIRLAYLVKILTAQEFKFLVVGPRLLHVPTTWEGMTRCEIYGGSFSKHKKKLLKWSETIERVFCKFYTDSI